MIPETISYAEAEKRYSCHRKAIKKAIDCGQVVAYQPGKKYLIDVASADKWFLNSKVKPIGRPRGV